MSKRTTESKKTRTGVIPIGSRPQSTTMKRMPVYKTAQPALHAAHAASVVASSVGIAGPMGLTGRPGATNMMGSMASRGYKTPVPTHNIMPSNGTGAGAGAPNFTGTWHLDREGSDSTNDYLEALGLPVIARQAADKLDLTVIIEQSATDYKITRKTRIFTETKNLKFGQEVIVKNNPIRVTATPTSVNTVSQLPGCRGVLVDTRTIEDDKRMKVVLELNLPDRKSVITNRYFKKISDSTSLDIDEELYALHTASTESKRKR